MEGVYGKLVEALVDRENNFAADIFYIMKLCSRLVFYCRNCPKKNNKFRYLIPILRKLGVA